ncbi:MAG: hypothetical protein ACKON9_12760 [Planctomycetaceae bacterium]
MSGSGYYSSPPAVPPAVTVNRGRRRLFIAAMLLLTLVACDVLARGYLLLVLPFGTLETLTEHQQAAATGAAVSEGASEVIHPYLGWVHNPQLSRTEEMDNREVRTNSLGFRDDGEAVRKRSADVFLRGIWGGSVACIFSWEGEATLRQLLSELPQLQGRRLQIVRLALPGYKQPQQLMALNYVLSLGGEFDAVLNIDGFNDGALSILENARQKTSIAYPRSWHARSLVMTDPRISVEALRLLTLRAERQQSGRQALQSPLRWLALYQLWWHLRDESARAELSRLGMQVSQSNSSSYLHHGPLPEKESTEEQAVAAADLWIRSSQQMQAVCRGLGIPYLHALQPNQYVPDSKPFTEYELERCVADGQELQTVTAASYAELRASGAKAKEQGLSFSDQTGLFREVTDTLYVDPWCHFNRLGNELLAKAVAGELAKVVAEKF